MLKWFAVVFSGAMVSALLFPGLLRDPAWVAPARASLASAMRSVEYGARETKERLASVSDRVFRRR